MFAPAKPLPTDRVPDLVTVYLLDDEDYSSSDNLRMATGEMTREELDRIKVKWAFVARVVKDIYAPEK